MNETTRESIRAAVLQKWAAESHGTAENFSRYRYNVETLSDGARIYIQRPAFQRKGCDFEVCCENFERPSKRPSHEDLVNELRFVCNANPLLRDEILLATERVWNCEDVQTVCQSLLTKLTPESVFKAERALKIAKWLFIEQDITDWNTSGRAMLMNGIREALAA